MELKRLSLWFGRLRVIVPVELLLISRKYVSKVEALITA
jgi:hypothetical protein